MNVTFARCAAALLPLLALLPLPAVAASFDARAFAAGASQVTEFSQTPALAQAVAIDSSLPTLVQASAYARTDAAGIHLSTVASATADRRVADPSTVLSSTQARAIGRFSDSFTVVARNQLLGTVGRARISLSIDGTVGGSGSGGTDSTGWDGFASWEASATFFSEEPFSWSGGRLFSSSQYFPAGFIGPINSSPLADFGQQSFWVPVTFGVPLGFELKAEVASQAGAVIAANRTGLVNGIYTANLSNTVAWGGILELRDADGALVTDYTARSDSVNFDYRQAYASAVPELPVWSLMLLGTGLVAARRSKASGL